jgi:hypothetical protein
VSSTSLERLIKAKCKRHNKENTVIILCLVSDNIIVMQLRIIIENWAD